MCAHRTENAFLVETGFGQQERLIAVIDETVGESHAHKVNRKVNFVQNARDFGPGTTNQGILFDADQQ